MSALFKDYIKERQNRDVVESENGFAIYEVDQDYIYLTDIYIIPEKRRSRESFILANIVSDIGRMEGCKYLLGTIDPLDSNADRSKGVLEKYGYTFWKNSNNLDWYKKEL